MHFELVSRMAEETAFLEWLPHLGDLQVAWLLLYYCAVPRANHFLRQLPPSISKVYAEKHDSAIFFCLQKLLEMDTAAEINTRIKGLASLPAMMGGLGHARTKIRFTHSTSGILGRMGGRSSYD